MTVKVAGLTVEQYRECFLRAGWSEHEAEELAESVFQYKEEIEAMDPDELEEYQRKQRHERELIDKVRERHRRLWEEFERARGQ